MAQFSTRTFVTNTVAALLVLGSASRLSPKLSPKARPIRRGL